MAGRRDNPAHRAVKLDPDAVPEVAFDYAFVRRDDEEETVTVLVMKDRGSRAIRTWLMPNKGCDVDGSADCIAAGVHDLGHRGPICVKSDNEPALIALREAVMAKLPAGAIPVQPVPGESQSNGMIEAGVKLFKGLLRVHLAALERKIGAQFPSKHPVVAWLTEHVGDVTTKYMVSADGKTAYERLYGKPVREEALEFGERVLYKRRAAQDMNVVLDARWLPALWLGRRWGSSAHRVYADGRVFDVRAVQRRPAVERWSAAELAAVRATPWRVHPGPDDVGELIVLQPLPRPAGPPAVREELEYRARGVYIRQEDLDTYGYTANCRRCRLMREGATGRGINHRPECRARIEKAMEEANDPRLREAALRLQPAEDGRASLPPPAEDGRASLPPPAARLPQSEGAPLEDDHELHDGLGRGRGGGRGGRGRGRAGQWHRERRPPAAPAASDPAPAALAAPGPVVDDLGEAYADIFGAFPAAPAPVPAQDLGDWGPLAARLRSRRDAAAAAGQAEVVEPEAGDSEMIGFMGPEVTGEQLREATGLFELSLIAGLTHDESKDLVTELFSVPRVTKLISRASTLGRGLTFDLKGDSCGRVWDFLRAEDRREALRQIQEQQPYIVIGSPPCTPFSQLQRLNKNRVTPEAWRRGQVEGRVLLDFAAQVYQVQLAAGRHFLHEHPASASSWAEPCIVRLRERPNVFEAVGDQCRFGLRSQGEPAKKPTRFLSSAPHVLKELSKLCDGSHTHVQLMQGRAAAAAEYPRGLCRAMLQGIAAQRRREGRLPQGAARAQASGTGIHSLAACTGDEVFPEPEQTQVGDEDALLDEYTQHSAYFDENTGDSLPAALVDAARREELDFMGHWRVWDVVPVAECIQRTGKKPIGSKWVDVNKGDRAKPTIRSRLVAREIAFKKNDAFYAATPPLEALRMILSSVASNRGHGILVMDASKAHLHASVDRLIYVDLPIEVRVPGMCARLRRCLYGTRDAPARWEAFLAEELIKLGFKQGRSSSCCFRHPERKLRCVVHGDDFTFAGPPAALQWVEQEMKTPFLVKVVGRLGPEAENREIRILNRVVRWGDKGLSYEADPRHVELLLAGLLGDAKPVTTPGVSGSRSQKTATAPSRRWVDATDEEDCDEFKVDEPEGEQDDGSDEPLSPAEASLFRSFAARANYLAMDRPDIAFTAKELCRRMKEPVCRDLVALRRVAQYLASAPRLVYRYDWQGPVDLSVYSDTDFAGCRATRRSTSGGCAMLGTHLLKHWSSTQKVLTLSSGEAELAGVVKGASEGYGLQSLALDLGIVLKFSVFADSSAAIGICRRTGIGKVRHLAVQQLWVQERVRSGGFRLIKVAGVDNPADLYTKYLTAEVTRRLLGMHAVVPESGRAATAPQVAAKVDDSLAARALP